MKEERTIPAMVAEFRLLLRLLLVLLKDGKTAEAIAEIENALNE